LDESTGAQIADLIFAQHIERGMTLLLVTHDLNLAQRCDRIIRLRSGRVVSGGEIDRGNTDHAAAKAPLAPN
jgi:predicted ABC-type transport system involved in lysophospholipase L1 biosynthesis ATPase subunit